MRGFLGLPVRPAQDRREAPLPSILAPESQSVLDKLASLSALPTPDWRYHAGDLAHGESPSLDDAGWQAVTTPSTLPGDALWMRATIEVPKNLNGYDLTGTQIDLPAAHRGQRSRNADRLLQRTPRGHGPGPRAHHALRRRPARETKCW